mgnify:CR=1 FL=1
MVAPTYRLTNQALRDLDDIAEYLRERSPSAAIRTLDTLRSTFQLLAANPQMGTARDDLHLGLRAFTPQRPAAHYIVFFTAIPEGVLVTDIMHGARNWEALFLGRER